MSERKATTAPRRGNLRVVRDEAPQQPERQGVLEWLLSPDPETERRLAERREAKRKDRQAARERANLERLLEACGRQIDPETGDLRSRGKVEIRTWEDFLVLSLIHI